MARDLRICMHPTLLHVCTVDFTIFLEFGLARSLRGLCKNENFLSCTPARCKILARNGLSSLARNITARPCKTLFPPNLTGPKGGATTLKMGGRASLLGSHRFLQDQNPYSLCTDSTYLCSYGLAFLARPGLQDKTQVSREKSHTCLARACSKTKL